MTNEVPAIGYQHERATIRCRHCSLMQFVTESGDCRRCRMPFVEPEPEVPESAASVLPATVESSVVAAMPDVLWLLRKTRKLSQSQLGRKLGVPRTQISKYESEGHSILPQSLLRLSLVLGIDVDVIVALAELRARSAGL